MQSLFGNFNLLSRDKPAFIRKFVVRFNGDESRVTGFLQKSPLARLMLFNTIRLFPRYSKESTINCTAGHIAMCKKYVWRRLMFG
jgi:hypothetical protein